MWIRLRAVLLTINTAMNRHRHLRDWLYSFLFKHTAGRDQLWILSKTGPINKTNTQVKKKKTDSRLFLSFFLFCKWRRRPETDRERKKERKAILKLISKELSIFLNCGTCGAWLWRCCIKLSWKWKLIRYDDWTPGIVISRTAWLLSCN